MKNYDVIILGAGAAGLMCAAQASALGHSVLVLDHANKAGKKILMSGGGRCNFTNYYIEPKKYLSHNPHFCKSALKRYTQWDFIALVEKHGIAYHEKKDGQLFCDTKASAILNMLLDECAQGGAHIELDTEILAVTALAESDAKPSQARYQVSTRYQQHSKEYQCQHLVVATGGPSIPTLGATGFGYQLAKQFGLKVYEPRAALVPFTISGVLKDLCVALSGTSLAVEVSVGQQTFSEDMLFTHRGLSGPAMLQISSYWQLGDVLTINLLPRQDVANQLRQDQHSRAKLSLKNWLAERTTQKFAEQWLALTPYADYSLAQLNGQQMDEIAQGLHQWQVKPAGTEGYRTAEVALGGVDTDELSSKTMESKQHPGLYFIGEVVDVTGWLGGYNFQWAWSSAVACAQALEPRA